MTAGLLRALCRLLWDLLRSHLVPSYHLRQLAFRLQDSPRPQDEEPFDTILSPSERSWRGACHGLGPSLLRLLLCRLCVAPMLVMPLLTGQPLTTLRAVPCKRERPGSVPAGCVVVSVRTHTPLPCTCLPSSWTGPLGGSRPLASPTPPGPHPECPSGHVCPSYTSISVLLCEADSFSPELFFCFFPV